MSCKELINWENSQWIRWHKKNTNKTFALDIDSGSFSCEMYGGHNCIAKGESKHSLNDAIRICAKNYVEGIKP